MARHSLRPPVGRALPRFSKDWTTGVRFDLTPEFMRAEYHRVDGTAILPVQDNPDPRALERRWDMFHATGVFFGLVTLMPDSRPSSFKP
ncbi:MAG: hypothetical protein IPP36_06030 [Nitrosomonadales bacterium]|nr:hypothetical protein [Nitrosomonadales bacterium]